MTRLGFLLSLTAFLASTATAVGAPPRGVPPRNPPYDAPGHKRGKPPKDRGGGARAAPAPLLGAGLPAIIAVAAAVGYRLWRRGQRPTDE
jgi:hypothetical protein